MVFKTLAAGLFAGIIFVAGFTTGERITEDNLLHTEFFEAVVIDGEGFYGEAVDERGQPVGGEGIFLEDVDLVPIDINEGDIVRMSWTQEQADNSDWKTPAIIEEVVRR